MVAGIVLFAFAMKATLPHVRDELGTIEALALCGGSALYLSHSSRCGSGSPERSAGADSSPRSRAHC